MNIIYLLDIWQVIFQHCDLLSQLRLISVCSHFYHSLFITDMYNIPKTYRRKLTNSVLKQKKFSRIIELDISWNGNIRKILFLTTLKKLKVNGRIKQQGVKGLDLIELDADYNKKSKMYHL